MTKLILIEVLSLFFLFIAMYIGIEAGPINVLSYFIIMLCISISLLYLLFKREVWHMLSLLLSTTVLSFVFYYLGVQIPPQFRKDLYKQSTTVEESINDNAFISEFQLLTDSNYNKCGIVAKYIFAEYVHHYKNSNSRLFVIDRDRRRLIFVLQNEDELINNGYGSKWTIENFSGNRIVLPYGNEDTIILSIFEKDTKNIIDSIGIRIKDHGDSNFAD